MKPSHTPFAVRVLDELTPLLASQLDDPTFLKELGSSIAADLLGETPPPGPIGRPMTERQRLLARLVRQVSFFEASLESVAMAAVFSRQFPTRKTYEARGITKVAYLRYHYEHYLQEVYRVREALITTIGVVEKDARRGLAGGFNDARADRSSRALHR